MRRDRQPFKPARRWSRSRAQLDQAGHPHPSCCKDAAPDGTCIIEGDEFHDVDIAVAARKVIVTCDELVSDEYIRRDPTLTRIFGECVGRQQRLRFGNQQFYSG